MNMRRGFTLIELLVVLAIISILTAVVMVNLTSYINKGKNASIKSNLSSLLTNATAYFNDHSSFENFCNSNYFSDTEYAVRKSGGDIRCLTNLQHSSFCTCSTLKKTSEDPVGSTICIDSTGYKKVTQNIGVCSVRCTDDGVCFD